MASSLENSENNKALLLMTADIVTAYVANVSLSPTDLPRVISTVHASLNGLSHGDKPVEPVQEILKPAVSIRKSITPDYIICLEDGKKLRMLKRHLRTAYGLSPDEYRSRWGLPSDYPMVAPSYATLRSDFAKKIGLGQSSSGGRKAGSKGKAKK